MGQYLIDFCKPENPKFQQKLYIYILYLFLGFHFVKWLWRFFWHYCIEFCYDLVLVKKFEYEESVLARWDLDIPKERNKSSLGVIKEDLRSGFLGIHGFFKGPKPFVLTEIHVHIYFLDKRRIGALCTFSFFSLSVTIIHFCICGHPFFLVLVETHFNILRTKLLLGFKPHIHHSWSATTFSFS